MQKKSSIACWGLGLAAEQESLLQELLGQDHILSLWPAGDVPSLQQMEHQNPCVLWISSEGNRMLEQLPQNETRHLDLVPKVLLLDASYTLADFEAACDSGLTEIVRPPLTQKRASDILRRALEAQSIHHDMCCMTREILLERELLERKNELLGFLVNFLTNTTESLDLEYILQTAFEGLGILLPVRSMHVALWEHSEKEAPAISLHICSPEKSKAHEEWREALLEHVRNMAGTSFSVEEIQNLSLLGQSEKWASCCPSEGTVISLPILNGTEQLGVMLLLVEMERHLGRDQATVLDSAMRHFALSIKNSRRFRRIQLHADYDALTRVHSRRHFEGRLEEEMSRFTRYEQPLSILMFDIDHFKQVNDTHGHHAGDLVLREVAGIIAGTIRTTDYCARYGGEEFAVLLPHTDKKKAFNLAERLRKAVAQHAFTLKDNVSISLTVSIGVGNLTPKSKKNKQALVCEADAALYAAKASGRNCTRDSAAVTAAQRSSAM